MAVVITSITPPRGRASAALVIAGSGFHATPGSNTVTINGQAATVTGGSVSSLNVTAPASGLGTDDFQKAVVVTNTGNGQTATAYWFLLKPATDYLTHRLQAQQPGTSEVVGTETATVAEAKDYERIAAYTEVWVREILPGAGGSTAPNTTSGAEKIGTDPSNFVGFTPARSTVQAALEAIDTRIAEVAAGASAFVVFKGYQAAGASQTGVVASGVLSADLESLEVDAFGTCGGGTVSLTVFGTSIITNPGPAGAVFWIRAKIIRTGAAASYIFAEFSNGANVAGQLLGSRSGEVVVDTVNGVCLVLMGIKHGAP